MSVLSCPYIAFTLAQHALLDTWARTMTARGIRMGLILDAENAEEVVCVTLAASDGWHILRDAEGMIVVVDVGDASRAAEAFPGLAAALTWMTADLDAEVPKMTCEGHCLILRTSGRPIFGALRVSRRGFASKAAPTRRKPPTAKAPRARQFSLAHRAWLKSPRQS